MNQLTKRMCILITLAAFIGMTTMVMVIRAVDAEATCDVGESSVPTAITLTMVDDDGDPLIDSSMTLVCTGPDGAGSIMMRTVSFDVENCEGSVAPPAGPPSTGDITATGSAAGTPDYVETLRLEVQRVTPES